MDRHLDTLSFGHVHHGQTVTGQSGGFKVVLDTFQVARHLDTL